MNNTKEHHPDFPSLGQAATLVLMLYFFQYIATGVLHDFLGLRGDELNSTWGIAVLLSNGALLTLILHYKQLSYTSLFHNAPSSPAATLVPLIVPVAMLVPALVLGNSAINLLLIAMLKPMGYSDAMFEFFNTFDFMTLLYSCVLAPFLEEMLFRGVILRSFLNRYPPGRAIIATALLFGIFHLNAYQFVTASLGGLVLGWLYERTRSLWPSIALHALYNACCEGVSAVYGNHNDKFAADVSIFAWMGCFALALIGAFMLRRRLVLEAPASS